MVTKEYIYLENETENIKKILLPCQPLMPTNTAYCNNLHRRLNMQITELSADCVRVTFICIQLTNHNALIKCNV